MEIFLLEGTAMKFQEVNNHARDDNGQVNGYHIKQRSTILGTDC